MDTAEVVDEGLRVGALSEAVDPMGLILPVRPYRSHLPRHWTDREIGAEISDDPVVAVAAEIVEDRDLMWPPSINLPICKGATSSHARRPASGAIAEKIRTTRRPA
jgi:hypothetical protein